MSLEDPFGGEPAWFPIAIGAARREEQSRARRGELMRGLKEIYPSKLIFNRLLKMRWFWSGFNFV